MIKNYKYIVLLVSIFFISKLTFAQGDISAIDFSPRLSQVLIGSHVNLKVIMIDPVGDTTQVGYDKLYKWSVNGYPDPNLVATDENATYYAKYNPVHNIPQKNPMTISCELKRQDPTQSAVIIVGQILVIDASSQFTLNGSGMVNESIAIRMASTENGITVSNASAYYIAQPDLSTLINTGMYNGSPVNVQLTFTGKTTGYFNFSKQCVINVIVNGRSFGSVDENGDPTRGYIEVTEFGTVGNNVVAKVYGTLMTLDNGSLVPVTIDGIFSAIYLQR